MSKHINKILALGLFLALSISTFSVASANQDPAENKLFQDPLAELRLTLDQERNSLVQIQEVLQKSILELQKTLNQVNKIIDIKELPASKIYDDVFEDVEPIIDAIEKDIVEEIPYYNDEDIDLDDVLEHEREFLEYLKESEGLDTAKFEEELGKIKSEEDFHKYISQFNDTEFDEVMPDEYSVADAVKREKQWLQKMQKEEGWDVDEWLRRLDEVADSNDWKDFDKYIDDLSATRESDENHDYEDEDEYHQDKDDYYDYHEDRYENTFSEDLDEAKDEAKNFLESIRDQADVEDVLKQIDQINSWEDFERLGNSVSPEVERLYAEQYDEDEDYDEDEHHREDEHHNDEYDDYQPSVDEQKAEIREILEELGANKAYLDQLDAATTQEDLENLEHSVPEDLRDRYEDEYDEEDHDEEDHDEEDHDEKDYEDHRNDHDYHNYDRHDEDYDDRDFDHDSNDPWKMNPEDRYDRHHNYDDDYDYDEHEDFDPEDKGIEPNEYKKTVDEIVNDLEERMEDDEDVREYFDELEQARSYKDLENLMDKIDN